MSLVSLSFFYLFFPRMGGSYSLMLCITTFPVMCDERMGEQTWSRKLKHCFTHFSPRNPFQNLLNCPAGWQCWSWGTTPPNCQLIESPPEHRKTLTRILVFLYERVGKFFCNMTKILHFSYTSTDPETKPDLPFGSNLPRATGRNLDHVSRVLDLWNETVVAVPQRSPKRGAPAAKDAPRSGEPASASGRGPGSVLPPTTDL